MSKVPETSSDGLLWAGLAAMAGSVTSDGSSITRDSEDIAMSLCSCPMSRRVVVLEEESGFLYLLFQFNVFKVSQFEFSPVCLFTFSKKV